MEKVALQLN